MHFINPFKGLRPNDEKASSITIPSTDHLYSEIVASHKKDNPWSYLNIFTNNKYSKPKKNYYENNSNSTC